MPNTNYNSDLTAAEFAHIADLTRFAKPGGRPRSNDPWCVLNAIFYLLRTGCQWRLLPRDFPPWGTVHYYFRQWWISGVWHQIHQILYHQTRLQADKTPAPTLGIMDSQTVKKTEKGGVKG